MSLGLLATGLGAAEVYQADVRRQDDRYFLHVESKTDASPRAVWDLLTDFEHVDRIHSTVQSSELLPAPEGGVQRVRIRTHPCILFYCIDMVQVSDFSSPEPCHLLAQVIPEQSDYRYGRFTWRLRDHPDGGTGLVFSSELEPSFWIPPLLGPWLLKSKLRRIAIDIVHNLDRLAKEQTSGQQF